MKTKKPTLTKKSTALKKSSAKKIVLKKQASSKIVNSRPKALGIAAIVGGLFIITAAIFNFASQNSIFSYISDSGVAVLGASSKIPAPKNFTVENSASQDFVWFASFEEMPKAVSYKLFMHNLTNDVYYQMETDAHQGNKPRTGLIDTQEPGTTVAFKVLACTGICEFKPKGTKYPGRFIALNPENTGALSKRITYTMPGLPIPNEVRATNVEGDKALVSWAKVEKSDGYKVYSSTKKSGIFQHKNLACSATKEEWNCYTGHLSGKNKKPINHYFTVVSYRKLKFKSSNGTYIHFSKPSKIVSLKF